jgi:hypothetical protein
MDLRTFFWLVLGDHEGRISIISKGSSLMATTSVVVTTYGATRGNFPANDDKYNIQPSSM